MVVVLGVESAGIEASVTVRLEFCKSVCVCVCVCVGEKERGGEEEVAIV